MKKYIFLFSLALSFLPYVSLSAQEQPVDTMYMKKDAEFDYETQSGIITLKNFVPGEMRIARDAKPIDAILVLDYSSSMGDGYSVDSTYTKIVQDKVYSTQNLYFQNGKSKSTLKNYNTGQLDNVLLYENVGGTYSTIKIDYKGKQYDLYATRYYDTNSSYSEINTRTWVYIHADAEGGGTKRVFIRMDGSKIEEQGTTTIGYSTSKFPKGVDGFTITPTQSADRIVFSTLKELPGQHTTHRIEALQFAAGRFIELVANHAKTTGKMDRIAVVIFAGGQSKKYPTFYGSTEDNYLQSTHPCFLMEFPTDKKYTGSEDEFAGRSFVAKRFVDMSSDDAVNILKYSISNSEYKGMTAVNDGIDLAKALMNYSGRTGEDVSRYVIFFSDGDPTPDYAKAATPAVAAAYDLKNSSTKKTTFFSIYCHSADPKPNSDLFMDHLSSNYPFAKTYNDGTKKIPADSAVYYKKAKDNLAKVFDDISQQIIIESSSKFDTKTTLNDFINNEYFQLPDEVDQSTAYDNIFVYENKCTGYDKSTNTYSWGAFDNPSYTRQLDESDGIIINIRKGDRTKEPTDSLYHDKIEIRGYDYGKNWCGLDISKIPNQPHGARIIVQIPFVYTTSKVWGDLPTNTEESGVTVVDKETGETVEEKKYEVPVLPFCYIKLQRDSLDKGESAIYIVEEVLSGGECKFVDKVVINGTGSKVDSCLLYGVPGIKFKVTETNWNWAYDKETPNQTKELDKTKTPYVVSFEFKGNHKSPTGTPEEKEKDPANLFNHDESYKVNIFEAPDEVL
ncbi:MAG: hypothetical protein MJY89_07980 [Bacteroidales bacterium]|nr:hypothetical protein [Bacteroidales bacterium]